MPGHTVLDELTWVHGMLRRDLATCRDIAAAVTDGAATDVIRDRLGALQTHGALFQMTFVCVRYCQFVHAHHGLEDALMFPTVEAVAPDLKDVIRKLESDHRAISDVLDRVEAAARSLGSADVPTARGELVDALNRLATDLLEHLDFEEKSLGPILASWDRWPLGI
jgi:Hemerythrin HHE cation binding domain